MAYMGSKAGSGIYQAIIALMPPHDTYIESHAGSGIILRRKAPAARTIALDLDPTMLEQLPAGTETHCDDAAGFLARFDFASAGRTLVYSDPPYLWATRTGKGHYKFDYTLLDHVQLLDTLKTLPCSIIISGYPHPLYDQSLPGWNTREMQTMTRGGVRTEKLWYNFTPDAAHWATFAGKDFRARQHIKRKADRWRKKFATLPSGERLAILAALLLET